MRIRGLRANRWRNLEPLDMHFDASARLHVLSGDNAQGKTNVIEALYYLAAFRSFRTTRTTDLVRRDSGAAGIEVEVEGRDLVRTIAVQLFSPDARQSTDAGAEAPGATDGATIPEMTGPPEQNRLRTAERRILLDGKPVRGVSSVFGKFSVVLFVPEDLLLIRAAPAARRRFVDVAVSGVETAYFAEAATFQRILRSRNAVLRGGRTATLPSLLDTYDEQLATAGARVIVRRRHLIRALAPDVDRLFRRLHGDLAVDLTYVGDAAVMAASTESDVRDALLSGLVKRRGVDERRGHTTFGPHTDDLEIHLGGRPAREHASQGQLRSLVLAMKLGELAHVEARRNDAPVLLLDDVPSELDPTRRRYLFETLAALSCQTVVSVADPSVVPLLGGRADFRVSGGTLTGYQVFPLQSQT